CYYKSMSDEELLEYIEDIGVDVPEALTQLVKQEEVGLKKYNINPHLSKGTLNSHIEEIYELIAGEGAINRYTPEEMVAYITYRRNEEYGRV
ncbi:MAG: hypothetical protein MUO73_04320, partial [Thermoplasmata archaeon]|nr:hypothetical protein [Thermoplasmata archaeon]